MAGIGYPDGQRVVNWDSPLQWDSQGANVAGNVVSPIFDCSRYGYTAGFLYCGLNQIEVDFTWYADRGGTVTLGSRTFYIDQYQPNGGQLRIPNLGPYVQVALLPIQAGGMNYHAQIFQTNRTHPLEFVPTVPYLIDVQAQALGANANALAYPSDLFSGPMAVWFNIANASGTLFLQALNASGTYDDFSQTVVTVKSTLLDLVAPPGSWRFYVLNGAAAATNFYLTAQPSLSGST